MTETNRNTLFRKSSIDRLNSPEQLNEYIRVARPGVWLVLGAVVLLLTGVILWGIFGTITSTVAVGMQVEGSVAVCPVTVENASRITEGMAVSVAGETMGTVTAVSKTPSRIEEDSYALRLSGMETGMYGCEVTVAAPALDNGVYQAQITLERLRPAFFVTR